MLALSLQTRQGKYTPFGPEVHLKLYISLLLAFRSEKNIIQTVLCYNKMIEKHQNPLHIFFIFLIVFIMETYLLYK